MMGDRGSFEDIRQTVERLRAERYAYLPASLVAAILDIEAAHVEDRGRAAGKLNAVIDQALGEERG
jgi:hypothetical protein